MPSKSAYTKIATAIEDLVEPIDCGTDQWAIALSNTEPSRDGRGEAKV